MKKQVLSFLLAWSMVLGLLPVSALAVEEFTEISTAEEFAAMSGSGKYRLAADIEVTEPYAQFGGTFDGNGHTITLKLDTSSNNAALFGRTNSGAVIQNLIVNAQVTASGYGSTYGTAGLVGQIYGPTTIENCGVTGTITNTYSSYSSVNVCGMVGYLYDALTLANCYSTADVIAISTSYSTAVGGLVGGAGSYTLTAENCYAAGTVTAGSSSVTKIGGFAGSLTKSSLTNCYYNSATGNATLSGLTGKTNQELKALAADLGNEFLEDSQNINNGYPILSCQYFDPNATYTVTVQVTPADFTLTWNGTERPVMEGGVYTFSNIAVGEYTYTVSNEAGDYMAQSGTVAVKNKDVTQTVSLELNKHSLSFTLDPTDATLVVLDGEKNVLTPTSNNTYTVTNGIYGYGASKFGYEDAIGTVTVDKADLTETVTLTAKPAHTVTFAYGDAPDGGEVSNPSLSVTTGEQSMEPTSVGGMTYSLPVGYDYTYTFKSANYAKVTGSIDLSGVTETGSQTVAIPLTVKTAWGGGDDISEPAQVDGVYQISSGSELAWLAQEVNRSYSGDFSATLTRDIDLGDEAWTPIGKSSSYCYSWTFDGQGYTVSGLKVDSTAGDQGLFGYVKDAVIRDLTVEGSVKGGGSGTSSGVGGLIGTLDGSNGTVVIENCVNKTAVSGSTNVGGIVGFVKGSGAKIIRSCANLGTIQAGASAGGIVGNFYYKCAVEDCYNRGDVSASQNAGGVAGLLNDSGASIKRCYTTTATAIGKKSSGTVETATVFCQGSDSLATTKTEAEMKSADFVAALGSAFLAGGSLNDGYPILDFQVVKYPVTFTVTPAEAEVTIPGATGTHNGDTWTFQLPAGTYDYTVSRFGYETKTGSLTVSAAAVEQSVSLTALEAKSVSFLVTPGNSSATVTVTWQGQTVSPESDGSYRLPYGDYHYLIKARGYAKKESGFTVSAASSATIPVTLTPSVAWDGESLEQPSGQGTQASPYQIGTGEELAWLADLVNTGGGSSYAVLTDDIDLDNALWIPIGNSYSAKFQGGFDGQGHAVSGLNVSGQEYAGLFGHADNASIQNAVVRGTVSGTSYAGGILGRADSGVMISNCGNESEVSNTGTYGSGGIVGRFNNYGDAASSVSGCYNSGAISYTGSGYGYAGGVVGYDNGAAPISDCYNAGAVSSGKYAGGIRGYGGSSAGAISNCYNIGVVTGDPGNDPGSIAPGSYSQVSDSYYLDTGSDQNSGATAKTALELQSEDFLARLNGEGQTWKKADGLNGNRPVLAWQKVSDPTVTPEDPNLISSEFIWISATDPETGEGVGEITPYLQWQPTAQANSYTLTLWNQCFRPVTNGGEPYEVVEKQAAMLDLTGSDVSTLPQGQGLTLKEGWLYADLTQTLNQLGDGRYYAAVTAAGAAVPTLEYVRKNIFGYDTPYNRLAPVTGLAWDGTRATWTAKEGFDKDDAYAVTVYKLDPAGNVLSTHVQSVPGNYSRVDCSGSFTVGGRYAFSVSALAAKPVMESLDYKDSLESRRSDDVQEAGAAGVYTSSQSAQPDGQHGEGWTAISTAQQWVELANVEDTYTDPDDPATSAQAQAWGQKYYLTADLDFSQLPAELAGKSPAIGNVTHRFLGTVDGNGHKITGLTLSDGDGGLFSYIGSTGYIFDLTVEGANLQFSDNAGVIARNNYGVIDRCAVLHCNITADTGAVIGGMVSRNYGVIQDSYVDGGILTANSPTATSHAGFAGSNEYGGVIQRCWTSMEIQSQSDYAGGFVGQCYGETGNPSVIRDCFALGDVSARGYSGGFVGRSAYEDCRYENCYAAGILTVTGKEGHGFIGGTKPDSAFQYDQSHGITNCYYNAASPTDENCAGGGRTLSQMASADFALVLNTTEEIWLQEAEKNGGLPYLKGVPVPQVIATQPITVSIVLANYNKDRYAFTQMGEVIDLTMDSTGNTRVVDVMDAAQAQGLLTYSYDTTPTFGRYIHTINGRAVEAPDGWMFTVNDTLSNVSATLATLQDGDRLLWFEGTTENRFQPPTWEELQNSRLEWVDIGTVAELTALASSTDTSALAKNYRLTDDLDLAGVTFSGIGSADAPFTGRFDGQGHTVSNVTIRGTENVGFFGVIKGATVKNLALTGLQATGEKRVGGLVGWSQAELNVQDRTKSAAGLVGNCTVSGTVSGRDTVGGLVGLNDGAYDAETDFAIAGAIDKCTANVTVTGTEDGSISDRAAIGGLVGQNDGAITKSAALSSVTAPGSNLVGGLVGSNGGDIYDSHANGSVTGQGNTGGFVGTSSGTVKDSYCLGDVVGTDSNVGGFAGSISAVENAVSAGTVTGGAGFAGTLSGQVTGVASQITAKNLYGNCMGDPALSPVGNTYSFSSDAQKAVLESMALITRASVAKRLYEMFGVTLPVSEALQAEAKKYADAVTVSADTTVGYAIALLKPGETPNGEIAVTVEVESDYLTGGEALTLAKRNAGAARTVSVRVVLSDGMDTLYHTVMVILPSGLERDVLMDAIAGTLTESTDGWTVMDMALYQTLTGKTAQTTAQARQQALDRMIAEAADQNVTASDRARLELTLRSIGVDSAKLYPANSNAAISNADRLEKSDLTSGGYQAASWLLLAELQGNVKFTDAQRQSLIVLLKDNLGDGLFGYERNGTTRSDPDTAGAALAALAVHYDSDPTAKAVVDAILSALPGGMAESGSFGSVNSDAMVIIGLIALGRDPQALKAQSGASVVDGLLSYVNEAKNGFLYHGSDNALATEQGFRALVALAKFDGSTPCNIYDFKANAITPGRATGSGQPSKPSEPSGEGTITVTLTLKTDTATWIGGDRLKLQTGSTVYHALRQALQDNQMSATGLENGYVKSVTKGNTTLAEFDKGSHSGWLYQVNGKSSDVAMTTYTLKNNDDILWYYTTDWTKDPTSGSSVSGGSSSDAATPEAPKVTIEKDSGGTSVAKVELPKGSTSAVATIPTARLGEGNVLVIVKADGTEEVIKKSLVEGENAYALVTADCTVKLVDNTKAFSDTAGHWAENSIAFASSHELFQGTSANTFSPDATMSRAMLATVLYRLEGVAASGNSPFEDVAENMWYTDAVAWASQENIVSGTGSGFAPDRAVSRQELVTMLYRYAKSVGMDADKSAGLGGYADGKDVAAWAKEAMGWAVANGLVQGRSATTLAPNETATRAEVAAILQRLVTLMIKG